jgi:hypothetical protein
MSRTDRIIGIVLGLIVGVVAVILFVFSGGSNSLDAPSLDSAAPSEPVGIERRMEPEDVPAGEQAP